MPTPGSQRVQQDHNIGGSRAGLQAAVLQRQKQNAIHGLNSAKRRAEVQAPRQPCAGVERLQGGRIPEYENALEQELNRTAVLPSGMSVCCSKR